MKNYIKPSILYSIIYSIILYSIFIPLACYCEENVQTIIITKEDIKNAHPTPFPVNFSSKDIKAIKIMERRHFMKTFDDLEDIERLKNLEYELLGRTWQFTPQKERIEKLKLASSNVMLQGTALPASISSRKTAKRMKNNEIQLRERDNVGLIDGFLRLINPEVYEIYRKEADEMYFKYEY